MTVPAEPAPPRWTFLRQWLKNPLRTAAVLPSSAELGAAMVAELPPGAQRVLKVDKTVAADGTITVARSDIFNKIVPFVPFTKLEGDAIQGNHNK